MFRPSLLNGNACLLSCCVEVPPVQCRFQHARKTYGFLDWAGIFLPMIVWLRRYSIRQNLLVSYALAQLCELPFSDL